MTTTAQRLVSWTLSRSTFGQLMEMQQTRLQMMSEGTRTEEMQTRRQQSFDETLQLAVDLQARSA